MFVAFAEAQRHQYHARHHREAGHEDGAKPALRSVHGGFDIAARCTAEGPPTDDTLEIRFAESAGAMLFESSVIADAGLIRCEGD